MPSPNIKNVKYKNLGWESSGDLIFPPDFDETKKYATILSAHPIGSCKEQTAGNVYGAALAQAGFLVFAFDASFQGDSGGEPRFIEDPGLRVGDFRFAIDYLVTLPYVDADRIGALGICGGGGYVVHAAMTEHRIRAVVSVTGVNFGRMVREGFSEYAPVKAIEAMGAQRTAEARGGQRNVIQFLPASVEAAKDQGITDIDLVEATDYYRNRCPREHGCVSGLFSFNSAAAGWDAYNHCETLLTQPIMIVVGDKPGYFGAYRDGMELYGRAGSKDKELVVVQGASHYQLYDDKKATGYAIEKMIPFFKKYIGEPTK